MSPSPYEPPATRRDARPAVILWFRIYAAVMAFAYLAVCGVAISWSSTALAIVCAGFALLNGFAAFVPFKPWGWTLALVALALGTASGAFFFAVPLLLRWLEPTTKAAFARL